MTQRFIGAAIILACAPVSSPLQAQRAHIGPHVAYNFDLKKTAIGAQAHIPIARGVEFYPSFDYYLVDAGTLVGFNGDLKFRTPGQQLYFGGGVSWMRTGGGGTSNGDTGFSLFGGLETRYGWSHPYMEFRGLFHNGSALQAAFGINITLY